MGKYEDFLGKKTQLGSYDGFEGKFWPDGLFDFQRSLVEWALLKGRGALFADTGLGKTLMQLTWAENIVRHENRPVLILTPLAVGSQTMREGEKFGIGCAISKTGTAHPGINIANYEKLHLFNPHDFAGVVCDESAILKSFDGVRRQQITEFMRKMKYRLLCTATPSPNEYIELGTSSEALGYLGYMDMLARFFKNNQGNSIKPAIFRHKGAKFDQLDESAKWRFKGHAEEPFWKWVCSWARAVRKPSDLGFDNGDFDLPPLVERQHMVDATTNPDGMLFALPAFGLQEQREERRRTLRERCEKAAELVNKTGQPFIVWCSLNDEGDLLEKLMPDAEQVSGKDEDDAKEAKFLSFIRGQSRGLITKEKIGAWGLNFQHCAHSVSFPTHSYEGYYQSIRRCWRFGQKRQVVSDIVTTEGEKDVLANLQRKGVAADKMFSDLIRHMNGGLNIERSVKFTNQEGIPSWL